MIILSTVFRAECGDCGLFKYVPAESSDAALEILKTVGWNDRCLRCTQTKDLK